MSYIGKQLRIVFALLGIAVIIIIGLIGGIGYLIGKL